MPVASSYNLVKKVQSMGKWVDRWVRNMDRTRTEREWDTGGQDKHET